MENFTIYFRLSLGRMSCSAGSFRFPTRPALAAQFDSEVYEREPLQAIPQVL
jgi:hypothetical protein